MTAGSRRRLRYIDWLRGFAVLLMIQTHAFDAWLTKEAKETTFFWYSRYFGGYPAALFLFLAGVSLALVADGARRRGEGSEAIARRALGRAAMVFGFAVLFRLWMFFASGFTAWEDLFRVDVLNCIAVSLALVAVVVLRLDGSLWVLASAGLAAVVALLTPFAWDGPWPEWTPARLGGYIGGRFPNALFPMFPWAAYTAAGAATGFVVSRYRERHDDEMPLLTRLAFAGLAAIPSALLLDGLDVAPYPRYDFWWTSPNYIAIKIGILLALLLLAHLFDRTVLAEGWSLVRTLGQASLLVYWIHIEIVYGAIVAPQLRNRLDVWPAIGWFVVLVAAMTALAAARLRLPRPLPIPFFRSKSKARAKS
jgi:uncharacterized membrane protein